MSSVQLNVQNIFVIDMTEPCGNLGKSQKGGNI
jgi:hypothetical protein